MLSVALEHRLMHAETFAYLLHSPVNRPEDISRRCRHPHRAHLPIHVMMEIPGGTVTLGQPRKIAMATISLDGTTNSRVMRFLSLRLP